MSALTIASRAINWVRLVRLPKHRARVKQARRRLRTIRRIDGATAAARLFAYARTIEPLVFEELVLCAFEDAGAFVVRGTRYTGDGGIDGCLWHPRLGWYAVQTKRYSAHINPQHVTDFQAALVQARFARGLFVHTGRTGAGAYAQLRGNPVVLISGERIVELLRDRQFPVRSR